VLSGGEGHDVLIDHDKEWDPTLPDRKSPENLADTGRSATEKREVSGE
jgi:hypothetical protein